LFPNHEFYLAKLKSSLRKDYGGHHDLVDRNGISVSQNDHEYFPLVNTSCSRRVSNSCSTGGIRLVNLVTNLLISHEWGNDREVFTSGKYSWSFCDTDICSSSIYIFWLPLLYLQTLLTHFNKFISANAQQSFLGWNMQNKVVRKSIFYTLPHMFTNICQQI
jgi:hypothetical protein